MSECPYGLPYVWHAVKSILLRQHDKHYCILIIATYDYKGCNYNIIYTYYASVVLAAMKFTLLKKQSKV